MHRHVAKNFCSVTRFVTLWAKCPPSATVSLGKYWKSLSLFFPNPTASSVNIMNAFFVHAGLFWCFHNLFNPLCPRLPLTARSFFLLHDCPIVASNHTLHTSKSHANRNGILMRFVASLPLLSTTSGDDLCLKFGWAWEMLWSYEMVTQ